MIRALAVFQPRYSMIIIHIVNVLISFTIAWLLRFDLSIPESERSVYVQSLAITAVVRVIAFVLQGLHRDRWWRYQGLSDMLQLFRTITLASVISGICVFAIVGPAFPRSLYILDPLVSFLAGGLALFATRIYREMESGMSNMQDARALLIYGAGVAGISLARDIRENAGLGYRVVGFIDDDPRKQGVTIMGLKMHGTGEEAARILERLRAQNIQVKEIVVAMPSASGSALRSAVARGKAAGVTCRVVPGLGELLSGRLAVRGVHDISVTDILGRDPVELNLEPVQRAVQGRSVLVTGAAGSIGSELCRQIAELEPQRLVAFDQAESELFRLEADLRAACPALKLIAEVGDIRDMRQVEDVIEIYGINSIFHAAAYKHVPLMERQICEAVRNNVIGTWNLAQAAWRAQVPNFLLISTDKAVNPTSIMGLTKRITELIVSAHRPVLPGTIPTRYVAVRFGNVLVSNGSVVPTFQKQIAAGGPVTVTHPDMRRYFMTVREAVQLVLEASTMGKGGEIFVLDMGTLVRIEDLARKMVTLAGFVPDEDIEIRYTGLRPGEKLFEEISLENEALVKTTHPKIRVFRAQQQTFADIAAWIAKLQHLVWRRDSTAVVEHMQILVPEYQPGRTGIPPAASDATGAEQQREAPSSPAAAVLAAARAAAS
jgi:FlaA1/EpsC-like NDP-sugar epimerase